LVRLAIVTALAGCASGAKLPVAEGMGPSPDIPGPKHSLIPTIDVADAKGWPQGQKPTVASGLAVSAFASGLDHPRWLYLLPNGDVLVAETNGPKRPDDNKGFKGWLFKSFSEEGWRSGAERQSHHAVARRGW
jgi:hypothetical protein